MIVFAIAITIFAALVILSPFWIGSGGRLQASASINSIEQLAAVKLSILKRFIEDERAFKEQRISKMAWDQRRQFLSNRYIDSARRSDYLSHLASEQGMLVASSQGADHD